uniref:MAP/microtubule affinity regulating kinase 4 n=1 Tax=Mus musculus TaxID=10090 RepID=A0A140LIY2_MOUSE
MSSRTALAPGNDRNSDTVSSWRFQPGQRAWHIGQWTIFGQRAVLVQPFPGCPLPELYRFLP